MSSPEGLIGRNIKEVSQEELGAARVASRAANLCISLAGRTPAQNGHQLIVFVDQETGTVKEHQVVNGAPYQSIWAERQQSKPADWVNDWAPVGDSSKTANVFKYTPRPNT